MRDTLSHAQMETVVDSLDRLELAPPVPTPEASMQDRMMQILRGIDAPEFNAYKQRLADMAGKRVFEKVAYADLLALGDKIRWEMATEAQVERWTTRYANRMQIETELAGRRWMKAFQATASPAQSLIDQERVIQTRLAQRLLDIKCQQYVGFPVIV